MKKRIDKYLFSFFEFKTFDMYIYKYLCKNLTYIQMYDIMLLNIDLIKNIIIFFIV